MFISVIKGAAFTKEKITVAMEGRRYWGKLNSRGFRGRGKSIRTGNNRYRGGNNNYNKNLPQTKCLVYGSVYHWATDGPDSFEARTKGGTFNKFWQEEPYTTFNDESTEILTKEKFDMAILDSGCPKTVCGAVWLEVYMDSLKEKWNSIRQ